MSIIKIAIVQIPVFWNPIILLHSLPLAEG
nr:MAG TPA: hypothetical protein [Bacteriophage sp.]